jgi:rod shape-determining protein MreD
MRLLFWSVLAATAVLFDVTLAPAIALFEARPHFLLLVVTIAGLFDGVAAGAATGAIGGAAMDLLLGQCFGTNLLGKLAAGALSGRLRTKVFNELIVLPVAALIFSSLISAAAVFFVAVLYGKPVELLPFVTRSFLPDLVYDIALIPVFVVCCRYAQKKFLQKFDH